VLVRADAAAVRALSLRTGEPVPGAPTLMASLEAHLYGSNGLRGGARAHALGPRPLAHGARAAGSLAVELLGGYRWRAVELTVTVDNALGARLREGEFHYASFWGQGQQRSDLPRIHYSPGPPRSARATVTAWF
jgi:hypothetical protein